MLKPDEVLVNKPSFRFVRLFDADGSLTNWYPVKEIVYATMTGTDLAVLRLNMTYDELKNDQNVDPFLMADAPGTIGEEIIVVSGLWEYTTQCTYEALVDQLHEGNWRFWDSIRYSEECETFGGTSGSPLLSVATGEIIGVNNTTFEGGTACTVNNPCEVDEMGNATTIPDASYAQQTIWLYECLTNDFDLDLDRDGCELPKPVAP